ncbi:MAG: hypothetical protein ABI743_08790 [bacterium]
MRRWLAGSALAACVILALGCNGPNGEKLGELMGDGSAHLQRGLTVDQLQALPSLTEVDLAQTLTASDYTLWTDHMQAVLVMAGGCDELNLTEDQINGLVNTYRLDVGTIVSDLREGRQTPEELLRLLSSVRAGVVNDLRGNILTGESQAHFNTFWNHNEAFWNEVGYPGGPTDLGADAVRELHITGPQAAQFIELFVKATIDFSRTLDPSGKGLGPETPEPSQEQRDRCEQLGMQYWNDMMAILTPEQVTKAWPWYRKVERAFQNYGNHHADEWTGEKAEVEHAAPGAFTAN